MKRADFSHIDNGLSVALDQVGPWWSLLIVWAVSNGHTRFEPIQRELRIARNILSSRLVDLVAADVLEKRQYLDRPVRFEYVLTPKGEALAPVLTSLEQWGNEWPRG